MSFATAGGLVGIWWRGRGLAALGGHEYLVLNAPNADGPNILMDGPDKHPGITHFALLCPDIMAAKDRLEMAGIALSGGPVRFGPGAQGIFVRDPDRNVIELHQRG